MERGFEAEEAAREDARLVAACLGGSEGAFDALVRRYQGMVYRVARSVVRSHADADDVAQETFVKAYQKLDGFRGEASFRTWITRIAVHTAINCRRSWWSRRRGSEEPLAAVAAAGAGAETELLQEERRAQLLRAIDGLPDRQRETVRLRLRDEKDYATIARDLGVTVGTVKANFFHAVRNLRRAMDREEPRANGRAEP
jgi:RNA polymerase sigma-70 factor (ECF subfamily)